MAGFKIPIIYFAVSVSLIVVSGQRGSEQHHVVGDEKGWDASTDLNSWSFGRLFKVGDVIWFSYTKGEESVVELESILELSSCDLSNPIKMYTDGLDKVPLDGEGTRFFASGNIESCKSGLKMHVNVHPKDEEAASHNDGHISSDQESAPSPDDESPPTPKPKPKPKRSPPPPEIGPDDDSPPTPKPKPKPKPKRSPPPHAGPDDDSPPHPKPKPKPKPSSSTMLDGCLFSIVLALLISYFL